MREELLQVLRERKGRHQLIFATNDATIPVMGDAELVIPLEIRDGHTRILPRASIDDPSAREIIKTLMRRGKEAFQQWQEKYGAMPPMNS